MTAKIIDFTGHTRLDIPPENVLDGAKGLLDEVVVVGYQPDGALYMAFSQGDPRAVLWLLAQAQRIILEGADGDDECTR